MPKKRQGLSKYLTLADDSRGVEGARSLFMREVAEIAIARGLKWQEDLAKSYNEVAGTRLESRNVKTHFAAFHPSAKVVANYAKAFGMSDRHVALLVARGSPGPTDRRAFGHYFSPVLDHLEPHLVAPLFEPGTIEHAVKSLRTSANFSNILDEALLAHERFKLLPESPLLRRLPVSKSVLDAAGVEEGLWIKWSEIAQHLPDIDLAEKVAQKIPEQIRRDELLTTLWDHLSGAFQFSAGLDMNRKHHSMSGEPLSWHEWLAMENLVISMCERRHWPVERLIENLHRSPWWQEFSENNDPAMLAQDHEDAIAARESGEANAN